MFEKGSKLNGIYLELEKEFEIWKNRHKKNYSYYNILETNIINIEE